VVNTPDRKSRLFSADPQLGNLCRLVPQKRACTSCGEPGCGPPAPAPCAPAIDNIQPIPLALTAPCAQTHDEVYTIPAFVRSCFPPRYGAPEEFLAAQARRVTALRTSCLTAAPWVWWGCLGLPGVPAFSSPFASPRPRFPPFCVSLFPSSPIPPCFGPPRRMRLWYYAVACAGGVCALSLAPPLILIPGFLDKRSTKLSATARRMILFWQCDPFELMPGPKETRTSRRGGGPASLKAPPPYHPPACVGVLFFFLVPARRPGGGWELAALVRGPWVSRSCSGGLLFPLVMATA